MSVLKIIIIKSFFKKPYHEHFYSLIRVTFLLLKFFHNLVVKLTIINNFINNKLTFRQIHVSLNSRCYSNNKILLKSLNSNNFTFKGEQRLLEWYF